MLGKFRTLLLNNWTRNVFSRSLTTSETISKPLTSFGRNVPERKQYLMASYNQLLDKNSLLVYQHNNLSVPEYRNLQSMAIKNGYRVQTCRAGIMCAALRQQNLEAMAPLFRGPSLVFYFHSSDSGLLTIENAKKMHDALVKQDKLLFLGAKVDRLLFSKSSFLQLTNLGKFTDLYGQLLGTLQSNPVRLLSLLDSKSQLLVQLLKQHSEK